MANLLDRGISRILSNKHFYYVYPSIVLLGILVRAFENEFTLEAYRGASYYVSSKNVINQIFAYKGNLIFGVLFFGLFVCQIFNQLPPKDLSYSRIKAIIITQFKPYFVRFVIKIISLHFIFVLIDAIFIKTGGHCLIDPMVAESLGAKSKSLTECMYYNGTWVKLKEGFCLLSPEQFSGIIDSAEFCRIYGKWEGGFDVSGHFCFLTTLSLILWNELALFHRVKTRDYQNLYIEDENNVDDWSSVEVINLWKWLVLATLVIWGFLLVITSIFYHTFEEIGMGLILGHVTPAIIYLVIPNVPFLHKYLS